MKCPKCRIGRFHPTNALFLYWLDRQAMIWPDAPARVCDVCGSLEFEDGFLHRMEFFIDRLDHQPSFQESPPAHFTPDEQSEWQPTRRSR